MMPCGATKGDAVNLPAPDQFNRDIMRCKQALQGGRTIAVFKFLVDFAG